MALFLFHLMSILMTKTTHSFLLFTFLGLNCLEKRKKRRGKEKLKKKSITQDKVRIDGKMLIVIFCSNGKYMRPKKEKETETIVLCWFSN